MKIQIIRISQYNKVEMLLRELGSCEADKLQRYKTDDGRIYLSLKDKDKNKPCHLWKYVSEETVYQKNHDGKTEYLILKYYVEELDKEDDRG